MAGIIATGNVALLIDADNASPASIDPVLTVLAELGPVNIRRVYGNWAKTALRGWAQMTLEHGIEPQQQFDLTTGKNATDMKMTIDAMDMLLGNRVTGFGIMSSDSDFTPLVLRIKQNGLPVYGFGRAQAPKAFQRACTRFIDVGALGERKPAKPAPGDDAVLAVEPAPVAEAAAPAPTGPAPVDDALITLLTDAYSAAAPKEGEFAPLGAVGQIAGNRSSFDTRNYGFKRLSDLFDALPQFEVERREGAGVWVRPKAKPKRKK